MIRSNTQREWVTSLILQNPLPRMTKSRYIMTLRHPRCVITRVPMARSRPNSDTLGRGRVLVDGAYRIEEERGLIFVIVPDA
jgi:hypothetical protein